MRRILLLCSIVLLFGCHTAPQVVKVSDTAYQIPVVPDSSPDFTPAGIPFETDTVFVTVPASSRDTHFAVHPKKKTIKQRLGLSNAPQSEVISDNPQATAEQPKQTIWWKWVVASMFILFIVIAIVMAITNRLTFPLLTFPLLTFPFWRR